MNISRAGCCSVSGCGQKITARGLCNMHYKRRRISGDVGEPDLRRAKNGSGSVNANGYVEHSSGGIRKHEHVLVAERVLGRSLPPGAVVHHVNHDPSGNRPENLVICPSQAYHLLLHRRERAYDACGDANKRKCYMCGEYDDVEALTIKPHNIYHPKCASAHLANLP